MGVVLTAAVVAAAGQEARQLLEKGEQIQNAACVSCHDLRPIQTSALDKEAWTNTVNAMIEKGATVGQQDQRVLPVSLHEST